MTQTPVEKPPYEALDFEGLERRANYRIIAFREDVLHALDKKDAAAIIYQIIERWQMEVRKEEVFKEIAKRKRLNLSPLTAEDAENMMWTYMSYNDFVRESGGALGYNTVIRMIDFLVNEKKVIEQRENHNPAFADYEYRINKTVMRELLSNLTPQPGFFPKIPKPKKKESTQMGTVESQSTQMGREAQESTQMGTASTQMGTEVYPFGGTSHNTHITHTKGNEEVAHATVPPSPILSSKDLSTTNVENTEQPAIISTEQPTVPEKKAVKQAGKTKEKQSVIPVANKAIPSQQKDENEISESEQEIWQRWCTVLKKPLPLTKASTNAVKKLAPLNPSEEDLNAVRLFCYKSNPDWFGAKGKTKGRVTLQDIVNNWEGWVSSQVEPVNLEEMRNGVHKQTALEHGSRSTYIDEEKARANSGVWGNLKGAR